MWWGKYRFPDSSATAPGTRVCHLFSPACQTLQLSVVCGWPLQHRPLLPAIGQGAGVLRGESVSTRKLILNSPVIIEILPPKKIMLWKQKSKALPASKEGAGKVSKWQRLHRRIGVLGIRTHPGDAAPHSLSPPEWFWRLRVQVCGFIPLVQRRKKHPSHHYREPEVYLLLLVTNLRAKRQRILTSLALVPQSSASSLEKERFCLPRMCPGYKETNGFRPSRDFTSILSAHTSWSHREPHAQRMACVHLHGTRRLLLSDQLRETQPEFHWWK